MRNDRIDDALARHFEHNGADDAAVARVLKRLSGPLPPQKHVLWQRWPGVLLDWQFAPAWPRLAALACCAALGFAVGAINLDRLHRPFAQVAGNDLSAAVFQPDALTGYRP